MAKPSPRQRDVIILFTTRSLRLFAYGALALILVVYLTELGLSESQSGLLLTMTMLGDIALSLWITTIADRVGRKRMLIFGALLMALGGFGFALSGAFLWLLLAATIGVISPSGNEVGPFLPIEQAALSEEVAAQRRTSLFAWYNLAGSLATAAGALVCGLVVQGLEVRGVTALASYRTVLIGYGGVGLLLGLLFVGLSPASEAAPAQAATNLRTRFGLHRSQRVVLTLSGLFALDAFAGGFVMQSLMAYWFHIRFDADAGQLGTLFFGANLLAGFSALAAARLARRFGLVNTMVFTHVPSNVLLFLVPLMPNFLLAAGVLLLRFAISQMDVPTRQSYTAAVVDPDERSAAAGITGVARSAGSAVSPSLAGLLLAQPALAGAPFLIAGILKLIYDGLLYALFQKTRPPEEVK